MLNRPGSPGQRPPQAQGGYPQRSYIESPDYLRGGYLDARDNARPELITTEAQLVAEELARGRLNYSQIRRFFRKIRFLESRLDAGLPFDDIRAQIASLSPAAADAVNRKVAPQVFRTFIDKNVHLSQQGERSFRHGFVQHFQSVVCYFPRQ